MRRALPQRCWMRLLRQSSQQRAAEQHAAANRAQRSINGLNWGAHNTPPVDPEQHIQRQRSFSAATNTQPKRGDLEMCAAFVTASVGAIVVTVNMNEALVMARVDFIVTSKARNHCRTRPSSGRPPTDADSTRIESCRGDRLFLGNMLQH